jgi:hypothetical protein
MLEDARHNLAQLLLPSALYSMLISHNNLLMEKAMGSGFLDMAGGKYGVGGSSTDGDRRQTQRHERSHPTL